MKTRRGRRALLIGALLGAATCGGDAGPTGPVPVATVTVSPSPASLRVGQTFNLSATALDAAGNTLTGRTVTWTSVNSTIASVTAGALFGVGEGSTTVSAIVDGTAGAVSVTVAPAAVASVEVRPRAPSVLMGETLQLTATPRSGTGTPLTGREIAWSTSDSLVATVSPSGLLTGVAGGPVTVTATVEQVSAATEAEIIDPTAPRVLAVTPFPMVEGSPATATGVNFGATPGENSVTVDGVAAAVTAADGGSVTFTVPSTGCRPSRDVSVRITSGGKSGGRPHPIRPATFTGVGVGEQVLLAGSPCLQFDATSAFETYLVGIQSVSANAASLVQTRATARTGLAAVGPAGATPSAPRPSSAETLATRAPEPEALALLGAHDASHLAARGAEWEALSAGAPDFSAAARSSLQRVIPPTAQVGDRFTVRVPPHFPGSCTEFTPITAELREITPRGYWLVDVDVLQNSYSDEQLGQIATEFEGRVAPTLESLFGAMPDTDGDPRIAFVASARVNQQGWLSYTNLSDYLPVSQCAASNEGDWAYLATPQFGTSFTPTFLLAVMGYSLAHDFTHVIQNRVVIAGGTRAEAWLEEGQAGLGEEAYAHAASNPPRSARQNYGSGVVFSQVGDIQPYNVVGGLAFYYGFLDVELPKAVGAPEQCSWLAPVQSGTPPGPCNAPAAFSASWAFMRWLTDHFGAAVGGDGAFQQALIDASGPGFDRVATLTGVPIETLLARFAATLYVDDRIDVADPLLSFPSWDLYDYDLSVFEQARLLPRGVAFTAFTQDATVRAGSTAYYLISGAGRPATAVEITGPEGGALDASVRVWAVRVE